MAEKPDPRRKQIARGVCELTLESFKDFPSLITADFNETRRYVWRGQQCSNWKLETSLSRRVQKKSTPAGELSKIQLNRFRQAARGRRGTNPPRLEDNELWALGQHVGLATPLLDWTFSPYVGLYFAFADPDLKEQTPHRCVFALQRPAIKRRTTEIMSRRGQDATDGIAFFEPESDENSRVLSQRGLFTISPIRSTIDDWIAENFKDPKSDILIKILVPNSDRLDCLKMLNRMNVNHLTLFPDLFGAAQFTNVHLDVLNY
jgi:hypothetical protein